MKNFETRGMEPGRKTISMIDVRIGDIMYIRQNKKIVAVKILSARVSEDSNGHLVGDVLLLDAERGDRRYESSCSQNIYRSVEDCRKEENKIGIIELDPQLIAKSAGLEVVQWRGAFPTFGLYRWDGFYPRKVNVGMKSMEFTFDGDSWRCDSIGDSLFYITFEECEADHYVEVVLFPEG